MERNAVRRKDEEPEARSESGDARVGGRVLALGLVLFLGTLGLYSRAPGFDFVLVDDTAYVTENPHVAQGLSGASVRWAFTGVHGGNWHPLTSLSHMLDVELFGLEPAGHHVVNVLLHALNAVLLFVVLWRATGRSWSAWIVAALFAWHPLRVESVAWIAERKDVLSGLFWMLTLLAYVRYVKRPGVGAYLFVLVAFALGLLAKPMVVTLPCVLLLLDVWPLGRFTPGRMRAVVLEKLPLFVLVGLSIGMTWWAQGAAGAIGSELQFSSGERVGNALVAYGTYLGKTFWPVGLAGFYPHPAMVGEAGGLVARAALAAVVLSGVSLLAWSWRRTRPAFGIGWLWFLGTLVPVVGLVQVGGQALADRYTYLPSIGLALAVVWTAAALVAHRPQLRMPAVVATVAVLLALCVASRRQIETWRDTRALLGRMLAVTEKNYFAHRCLGEIYRREGDYERARQEFEAALAIGTGQPTTMADLGAVLVRLGDMDGALARIRHALELDPELVNGHYNLGVCLALGGELERARISYRRTLELDPEHIDARVNLGDLLLRSGRAAEARVELERVVALDPRVVEARYNLALALLQEGERGAAIGQLFAALEIEPEMLPAASALAWILATDSDPELRDGHEALRLAELCLRLAGDGNARLLETAAAASAEVGDLEAAVRWQKSALAAAPPGLRQAAQERLALYEAGRPFHTRIW